MELGECSTSTPRQANRLRGDAFHGVTPQASAPSSSVMKKGPWDVFINHRGCDTKHTLASTIYHTLDLIQLRAFLDEKELELGDSIPGEIHEAMRTAGLHIAIFSKSYAESPWCLAELCFMLETRTPILPVFYYVDPSDLRWVVQGKGCYAHAFSRHERTGRYPKSKVEDWKRALERASNLSGQLLMSNTGDEGMLLKSIVNSVLRMMKKEPLEVAKHPVGMDEIVQDFERFRGKSIESEDQHGVEIVGILGFGGSGKTTLATELYNRKGSSFTHYSFLRDVRDAASKEVLHTKQKKLLGDLRLDQTPSFDNWKEGKKIVADRLKGVRGLIVLDDVEHEDQLDALLPPKESLGSGSLVIITTREEDVLRKRGITSIYKIKALKDHHAKQLFCWHAFLRPTPLQGFEDLVQNYIDACNGLPLSLKVIGGQLYGKESKEYWVSQLEKIRRILPKEILERLKVSYDSLDKEEQEIFLDIACFFIGQSRRTAIAVWDGSGWSGHCSWETLHNKCLVEVYKDWFNGEESIRMHDHLRDLGREIAKTHSRSRIWFEKPTPFRGITDTGDRRVGFKNADWSEKIEFTEECAELSSGPLWLRWPNFQHTCLPSWLSLENIRVLEIYDAKCMKTLWDDAQAPLQLRELRIEDAHSLQSLPRSIRRLKHLKFLSLVQSRAYRFYRVYRTSFGTESSLSSLPEEFCQLQSLEHLYLKGCDGLSSLPELFGDLVNLRHLDLSYCTRLKRLPESFKQLLQLQYLDLNGCESLESLQNITNLNEIHFCREVGDIETQTSVGQVSLVFGVELLDKLHPAISELSELKELEISASELEELPTSLENLSSLTNLTLYNCHRLTTLPASLGNLSSLTNLTINYCNNLTTLPTSLGNLSSLTNFTLYCNNLTTLPASLGKLSSLTNLALHFCFNLTTLPASLENLSSLTNLSLEGCKGLTTLPASLGNLSSLTNLSLKGCKGLTTLPASLGNLSSLTNLLLKGCEGLTTLPVEIGELCSLQTFKVVNCRRLSGMSLAGLVSLKHVKVKLRADNISAFEPCIQTIQMESWPCEMIICGRMSKKFLKSVLDSFAFPGRAVVAFPMGQRRLTSWDTNLSNAAVVCFLVENKHYSTSSIRINVGESTFVKVKAARGEWIVMCVFREVSRLIEDGGGGLHASVRENGGLVEHGGWLMVGERGCVLQGFKQLYQTLCNAIPSGFF